MSELIVLKKTDIHSLIKRAYEEGWLGYKELAESEADNLLEEYLKDNPNSRFDAARPTYGSPIYGSTSNRPDMGVSPQPPGGFVTRDAGDFVTAIDSDRGISIRGTSGHTMTFSDESVISSTIIGTDEAPRVMPTIFEATLARQNSRREHN